MSAPNNKASLGCWTLILIALIVMIFSNSNRHGDRKLEHEIEEMQSRINNLQGDIENQSKTLSQIKESLDEIKQRVAQPQPRPRVVMPARPQVTPEFEDPQPIPEN